MDGEKGRRGIRLFPQELETFRSEYFFDRVSQVRRRSSSRDSSFSSRAMRHSPARSSYSERSFSHGSYLPFSSFSRYNALPACSLSQPEIGLRGLLLDLRDLPLQSFRSKTPPGFLDLLSEGCEFLFELS